MHESYAFECGNLTKDKHVKFHGLFKREEYVGAFCSIPEITEQMRRSILDI